MQNKGAEVSIAIPKAKKPVKTPIEGPKTSDVSKVDDLFGMGNAPMGYKYGSRK